MTESAKHQNGKAAEILEKRIFEDACEIARVDAEYKGHMKRIAELSRKLTEHLGPVSLLFLEYETLIGLAQGIELENAYHIGMEDGKKKSLKMCCFFGDHILTTQACYKRNFSLKMLQRRTNKNLNMMHF